MESESEKTQLKIEFTAESGMISAPILDSLLVDNSPSPPRNISDDPNEKNHHQDPSRNSDQTGIKAENLNDEPMETDLPDQASTKTIFEQIMTDSETEDEKEVKLNDMGEGGVLIPIRWYKCEECLWARFQSIQDLLHHQMTTHKDNENKQSNHNFPARRRPRHFICPTCKREFRSGFELGLHLETKECVLLSISKNKKKTKAPEMAKKIEGGEWQCIRCIYKSRDKYNVIRHYKYGHYQQVDCFISKDKSLREIALEHNQLSKIREAEIDLEEEQKRVEKQKAQQKRKLERKQEQEALDKRREERERKKKERELQMAEKRQKMEARKKVREEKKRAQTSEKQSVEGFSEELKKQASEDNKEMLALKALKSKERAEKTLARKIAKEKLAEEKRIEKQRINEEKQRQLQEEKRQYMAILEEKKRVAQERYAKLLEEEKAQKLKNLQNRKASLSFNSSNNSDLQFSSPYGNSHCGYSPEKSSQVPRAMPGLTKITKNQKSIPNLTEKFSPVNLTNSSVIKCFLESPTNKLMSPPKLTPKPGLSPNYKPLTNVQKVMPNITKSVKTNSIIPSSISFPEKSEKFQRNSVIVPNSKNKDLESNFSRNEKVNEQSLPHIPTVMS